MDAATLAAAATAAANAAQEVARHAADAAGAERCRPELSRRRYCLGDHDSAEFVDELDEEVLREQLLEWRGRALRAERSLQRAEDELARAEEENLRLEDEIHSYERGRCSLREAADADGDSMCDTEGLLTRLKYLRDNREQMRSRILMLEEGVANGETRIMQLRRQLHDSETLLGTTELELERAKDRRDDYLRDLRRVEAELEAARADARLLQAVVSCRPAQPLLVRAPAAAHSDDESDEEERPCTGGAGYSLRNARAKREARNLADYNKKPRRRK